MSKDIKEIYTDAKSSIEKDISSYKENTKKISDINEAAKIHLKENLNWYKIKYAKTISSDRKDAILKDVIELFPGADKKVLSAINAGASVFFVPNNPVDPEILKKNPTAKTNYEEAKEAAEKANADIEIVPVTTVQEAIDYLKSTKSE